MHQSIEAGALNDSNLASQAENHTATIQAFLQEQQPQGAIIDSYVERFENRRITKWPQLQKALEVCKQKGASLLIIELGGLSSNESFTQVLLASNIAFHCLDQPFVNQSILEALSKHAAIQRELHGKKIRAGLKLTSKASGNPNAAAVIGKVNKPKIDTAIVFASLLQPIIQDYRGKSQRQMVKKLNEEGFTAPEGGKWVLSQLQKVLERVRVNELATELKPTVEALTQEQLTPAEIAMKLNAQSIPPLKQPAWDEAQVKKLQDRIQHIKEITLINRFVLDVLPLLHEYHHQKLSPADIIRTLQQAGMPVQQKAFLPA